MQLYHPETRRGRERDPERETQRERHQITSSERHTIHRYCPSPSRTPQKPGQRDTVATVWSVRYSRKAGIPDIPPSITHTEIQKHRNTETHRERKRKTQKIPRTHKNAQKPSPRFVVRALHKQMTHNIASVRTEAGAPR